MEHKATSDINRIIRLSSKVFGIPFAIVAVLFHDKIISLGKSIACNLPVETVLKSLKDPIHSGNEFYIDRKYNPDCYPPNIKRIPALRFYAGMPIPIECDTAFKAYIILIDTCPRHFSDADFSILHDFAQLLSSHVSAFYNAEVEQRSNYSGDRTLRWQDQVLENIEEPLFAIDKCHRIVYFNEPAARMFEVDKDDAIGRPWTDIAKISWVKPKDTKRLRTAISNGHVWRGRNTLTLRNNGKTIVVDSAIRSLADDTGDRIGILGIVRDTTERSKYEEALRQSNLELNTLVDAAPMAIISLDRKVRVTRWNSAAEKIFGWSTNSVKGWEAPLKSPDPKTSFDILWRSLLSGEPCYGNEIRCYRADGDIIDISISAAPLRDFAGKIEGIIAVLNDITQKKREHEALWQAENNYRSMFENAFEGIFQSSPDGRYINVNPALARIYGYDSPQDLIRGLTNIRHQLYVDPVRRSEFIKLMHETDYISGFEAQVYRKDGAIIWISESSRSVCDVNGNLLYYEGMVVDITGRKMLEEDQKRNLAEANERADRDPLTQLFNHRSFHKRLQQEAERAICTNSSLSVAIIDLDNFKFFNDVYGHTVGDDVLKQVSAAILRTCRSDDILARFGGDELALIMPNTKAADVQNVIERIHRCLDGMGYRPVGYDAVIPFSVSVGVASLPEDGVTRFELIEIADTRLRHAKAGDDDDYAERMRASIRESLEGFSMLDALVKAVDTKDRYTRKHSEDVMVHSAGIARELKLSRREIRTCEIAGLLHDVGKIGVPDSILRKPGHLSEIDMQAVCQHPMMGAIIIGAVPGFEDMLDAIRHHHERWDGDGYPFGLKGEEIPLLARVMAVADAYSAMTTDRPYRKGMRKDIAVQALRDGAGTQWDPACVEAFIRYINA